MLITLDNLSNRIGKDIWITSANDGKHRKDSYHYKNLALDIRIWNLNKNDIDIIIRGLKEDNSYHDVVLEKDHIHCEFDERSI